MLGVVGLVIGGIWVAAVSVRSALRVNAYTKNILWTINQAKRIFPAYSYSTTTQYLLWTYESVDAGVFPKTFIKLPLYAGFREYAKDSDTGMTLWVTATCNVSIAPCPSLGIGFGMSGSQPYNSDMSPAECTQMVRRVINALQLSGELISFRLYNGGYTSYTAPINASLVSCLSSTDYGDFFVKPY